MRLGTCAALVASLVTALTAACDGPAVLVTIEGRPTVHAIARLDVSVRDPFGDARSQPYELGGDDHLPLTLRIAVDGREGPIAIDIDAVDRDGTPTASGSTSARLPAPDGPDVTTATVLLEPTDFVVNAAGAGRQLVPSMPWRTSQPIAVAADGAVMVTFDSNSAIATRRFDATATLLDGDERLDDGLRGVPVPSVAAAGRRYLVAWDRDAYGGPDPAAIALALYDDHGVAVGATPLVEPDGKSRWHPALTATGDGWVVAYQVPARFNDSSQGEIRATAIAVDGTRGAEVVLVPETTGHLAPTVAGRDDGFLLAWLEAEPSGGGSPFLSARAFDPDGVSAQAAYVFPIAGAAPRACRATATSDGYALVWHDRQPSQGFDDEILKLVRFSARGELLGDYVEVARLRRFLGDRDGPAAIAARAGDGAIAVVWADTGEGRGDTDIFLRLLRPDGVPCGPPAQVNTTVVATQSQPAVAAFGDDAFAVTWTDESGAAPDRSDSAVRARIVYAGLDDCY